MTETKADSNEALLAVIGLAQDEIGALLAEFDDSRVDELRQICNGHLENILWAANEADLQDLYLITDALLTALADPARPFDATQGSGFLSWLTDLSLVVESPHDPDLVVLLLSPLSADIRESLGAILFSQDAEPAVQADMEAAVHAGAEWPDESDSAAEAGNQPDEPEPSPSVQIEVEAVAEPDQIVLDEANTPVAATSSIAFPDADDDLEIDTDNMLGMLAYELRELAPQLTDLALKIVTTGDREALDQQVAEYLEMVQRVALVATELELGGLQYICEFIGQNIELTANLPVDQRDPAKAVLQGWPQVLIEHLVHPDDDSRCIALIDYLERDNWPQPVPYRDQRDLIEGLTKAAEACGETQIEVRELRATADQVSLEMSADASVELIEAFFAETPGHAETFSSLMTAISNGEDVQKNVEAAQRIAHTLKGSGNLIGVKGIANLAHHIEDIFEHIAKNQITPPVALATTMQEAADSIEGMLEYLQDIAPPPDDAQRVLQDVLDWANRIDSGQLRHGDFAEDRDEARGRRATDSETDGEPTAEIEQAIEVGAAAPSAPAAETVRVPLKLLDNIFRIVSESAIGTGQIQERLNRLEGSEKLIRKNDGSMQQQRYELENLVSIRAMAARHRGATAEAEAADNFDPLEMDEYDEFYGATHSFIESVADSREILRGFSSEVYELNALFVEQQRLNKELQQMVMTTRMVPVSNIAARLQRTVRQVCRTTAKQAQLSIAGQDLLLDGDVLGKLADPMMHMLRNAIDHGIESPAAREGKGKSAVGQVKLDFRQEGNNVVVRCQDDGGGLDYERIRRTATERGLLADSDPTDNASLARLILQSGFSTSDTVTHISGRGVGMDVVHNTIQSLNGSMDIEDGPGGEGTLVTLRLPITLLTSHCLLAGIADNLYALPTISLTQILSPGTGHIGTVGEKMTYQLEHEVYPACKLSSLIGAFTDADEDYEKSSVLLVHTANGVTAVTVERVVTSYDLVVKNMGAYIKSVSGIAGVSMLGNGEVVAVLDLATMLQAQAAGEGIAPAASLDTGAEMAVALPSILIVDDSLSVRNALSQLMRDAGYQPIVARDGLEAINILESESPDVVLTDLEMPRMNGFELISYVRNSNQLKDLPIVMITSRNMAKHRQQAEQAGVNEFIPKPFTDDQVLEAIDEQLAQPA